MAEPSKLQIADQQQGDVSVLVLSGELTLDDGDIAFGRYVDQMIEAGRRQFVIDLSGVNYIDSAGVGMLVAESKRVTQNGGAMRLARLTARSHHLLAMLKLKFVFEVYDDVDAAVRSFGWRPQ
ncbi:MAG TPA: STAS domain-containing protein [Vicinamibacterales bacterium]|jgi:anti-sigma B factor antagonist|nr:STAS domain-containing protein [Vicinamibacterales bacterium]